MIHCPKCQSELPHDARFCNTCGFNQTNANMVSVLERIAQQSPPAVSRTPAPQEQSPSAPGQPFARGILPTTPVPGKEGNNGPYDTIAQVTSPDTPPARRLSLRERYLAEQGSGSHTQVPSQPLAPPAQPGQPAAGSEGQGRTRLSHFISRQGAPGANNISAPAPQQRQPQAQPGNRDDQGWIEPEQRYRQNQIIRTSTPRPPNPVGQPQPIVRVSTPPARPGPGARGAVPAPPQPQSYALDALLQQNTVISNASRFALDRWRQGWWERQHSEAAPAVGVSRGQAAVPEPLMRMQHSIARMRAIILPKKGDDNPLQENIGLFTIAMIAFIVILIIYNLLGTPM
jgi:hypothetical protein